MSTSHGTDQAISFYSSHPISLGIVLRRLADGGMDAVVSQEALLHVPDKGRALAETFRILRRGGRLAFTDWACHVPLSEADAALLWEGMAAQTLQSLPDSLHPPERSFLLAATCLTLLASPPYTAARRNTPCQTTGTAANRRSSGLPAALDSGRATRVR